MNPANQKESLISWSLTIGIATGETSGNSAFCLGDKPLFWLAFIERIYFNPLTVRCSLFWIIKKTFLNKIKSARFWVISG